jgi:hypothetical protein
MKMTTGEKLSVLKTLGLMLACLLIGTGCDVAKKETGGESLYYGRYLLKGSCQREGSSKQCYNLYWTPEFNTENPDHPIDPVNNRNCDNSGETYLEGQACDTANATGTCELSTEFVAGEPDIFTEYFYYSGTNVFNKLGCDLVDKSSDFETEWRDL